MEQELFYKIYKNRIINLISERIWVSEFQLKIYNEPTDNKFSQSTRPNLILLENQYLEILKKTKEELKNLNFNENNIEEINKILDKYLKELKEKENNQSDEYRQIKRRIKTINNEFFKDGVAGIIPW